MSDAPQDPDSGTQEGGYGYPTLEQEVTPEVLEAGAERDGTGGETNDRERADAAPPGSDAEDPPAVEPTD